MQLLAPRHHHVLVDRLAGQRVAELVAPVVGAILLQQLIHDANLDGGKHRRLIDPCDLSERRKIERTTNYSRGRQHGDLATAQALEPVKDRVAHGAGDAKLVDLLAVPALRRPEDVAAIERVAQHLFDHEGISLAPLVEKISELIADNRLFEDGADDVGYAFRPERFQLDHLDLARTTPALDRRQQRVLPVHLVRAIGGKDQDICRPQPSRRIVEQLARCGVGPVQVLEHDQERAGPGRIAQQQQD